MTSSSSSSFDSEQFKVSQRQSWDSAASGWKEWLQTLEIAAQKVNERLVELAEIKPGQKVLDIATGIGEPAITAARKLVQLAGSGNKINANIGHVLAIDISSQMLTVAKQRAATLGFQEIIEFRESDAEVLALPCSSFDAVLCRWGLMFMPNLNKALSNAFRALKSCGRFVCTVWAETSKVPFGSIPMSIVMRELNVPPPPPGTPGPFALADINILRAALSHTGFTDIKHERLNVTFEFATVEDYINYTKAVSAPIKNMLGKESVKRQEEIWDIVRQQVRSNYSTDTGGDNDDTATNQSVKMDNECICTTAKKP
jgi:ubiquinone/menaquinone biosynthesis C-methylase UbiE